MMLSNSAGSRQPARGAHADLVGLPGARRRRAHLPGRDLHVLLAQRLHHLIGGDVAAGQAIGIEPQAHRVAAFAEDA